MADNNNNNVVDDGTGGKHYAYQELLDNNRKWAASKIVEDPEYFTRLAKIQTPQVLWIGCADSRVPPNETTGTRPGDIFVHRNVANQVIHTDMNLMSVLQYGVEALHIPDIIVCGHYGCGGVRVALGQSYNGLINKWLTHIKDIYVLHRQELEAIKDPHERENRMIELNVQKQVYAVCQTSIVQRAWRRNGVTWDTIDNATAIPRVHGWVYDLKTGLMKDLKIDLKEIHKIYRLELSDAVLPTTAQNPNNSASSIPVPWSPAPPRTNSPKDGTKK